MERLPNARVRRWTEQSAWDGTLRTLAGLGLTNNWQRRIDNTNVRGHVSEAGEYRRYVRRLPVDLAADIRTTSMPTATIKDCLSVSF